MTQSPDKTRSKILDTALDLFSRQGYNAAGVAEICQAAGVSKGAFYHHFPSKHAVFMELLGIWLDRLLPEMDGFLRHSGDIPSGLMDMTSMAPAVFSQAENRLPMFLEFWTQASRDREVWQATIAPYRQFLEMFSGYIRRGVAEGSLADVDADSASRVVLAVLLGMILQGMMDPAGVDWSRATRQGMQIVVDGMQRRTS